MNQRPFQVGTTNPSGIMPMTEGKLTCQVNLT